VRDDKITIIRDYRYVRYVMADAEVGARRTPGLPETRIKIVGWI